MSVRAAAALLLAAFAGAADGSSGALPSQQLLFPVPGYDRTQLRDTFEERRGKAKHEALDIMAKRGTPVVAVDDGRIVKLFKSAPGGITLYQFDPQETVAYYYAHLDRYAPGIAEGRHVQRGDVIGYVGSTGNAVPDAPHLHFAIYRLGADRKWWRGKAINPYPYFASVPPTPRRRSP